MRIFQWSAADDGSNWWRLTEPGRVLRLLGHHVDQSRRAIPSLIETADVIIAHRVLNPGPTGFWQAWAADGRHLVFDLDDHLEHVPQSSGPAYHFFNHPPNRDRLRGNLAAATRITAASERIAEWAAAHNPDVHLIPNGLPAAWLDWPTPPPRDQVVVGWAGSLQTVPELALAAPALVQVLDRYRGRAVVHIHGVHPDPTVVRGHLANVGLDRPDVVVTPWADPGEPYLRGIDFDIWCAPYRPIPFNRAKFPTKWLEALFRGVPLLASRVGGYATHVRHGQTGYLVREPDQWYRYLRRLIDNPNLRTDMAAAARAEAVLHIVEGYGPAWEKALTPKENP